PVPKQLAPGPADVSTKKEVHPLDEPDEPALKSGAAGTGALPRANKAARQWTAEMIYAFMEKSNIRWMELTAATLIVVCSVGLVISLWSTLASTSRFFPSIVFMVATLAVHGAGQYTLKQWKLQNTSRGILHIALMLIPLSVMIGILLSRRNGALTLDGQSVAVLVIGATVYGGLAITAAQSLFNRSWIPVATTNIVASLSLVPIAITAKQGISLGNAAFLLLPTALAALAFSWDSAGSGAVRQHRTFGFYRRQLGTAVQMLFCSIAVVVFWCMQLKTDIRSNEWAWLLVGASAAAWGVWGAIHSNLDSIVPRLLSPRSTTNDVSAPQRRIGEDTSGLVIVCWLIGLVFSLLAGWSVWRLTSDRTPLLLLLAIAGTWQWSLGWMTRSWRAVMAGCLVSLFAGTLWIEAWGRPEHALIWSDWVSWQRVLALGGLGAVMATLGTGFQWLVKATVPTAQVRLQNLFPSWIGRWQRRGSLGEVGYGLVSAGGIAIGTSIVLSLLASLMPWGETPYGGNWSPILVMLYGCVIVIAGLAFAPDRRWVVGLGQALCLLATYRIGEQATWLPSFITQWRPHRSSAITFSFLSLLWIGIGTIVGFGRTFTSPNSSPSSPSSPSSVTRSAGLSWLLDSSIVLAILAWVGLWCSGSPLLLMLPWGWILPAGVVGSWLLSKKPIHREWAYTAVTVWLVAWMIHWGEIGHVWDRFAPLANVQWMIAMVCGLSIAWWSLEHVFAGQPRIAAWFQPALPSTHRWWSNTGLIGLVVTTVLVVANHLFTAIGWIPWNMRIPTWLIADPAQERGLLMAGILAIAAWSVLAWLVSRSDLQRDLRSWMGIGPWLAVLLVGSFGTSSHPWVMTAWLLSGVGSALVAISCIRSWTKERDASSDVTVFEPRSEFLSYKDFPSAFGPWDITAILSWFSLLLLSIGAIVAIALHTVPGMDPIPWTESWASASSQVRWSVVLTWLGPVLLLSTIQWIAVTASGRSSSRIFAQGGMIAGWVAIAMTMIPASLGGWATEIWIAVLGAIASSASGISWLTLLASFLGVRGRSSEAARGAAWSLASIAMVPWMGASVLALVDIVQHAASAVSALSILSGPTLIGLAVTLSAYIVTGAFRGMHFGSMALPALGLIAPILSVCFGDFLLRDWGRSALAGTEYRAEPLHAMLLMWLFALTAGAIAELRSTATKGTVRTPDGLWWILATMVAILGGWCPDGTAPIWVLAIGGGLSLLVLIKGLVNEQPGVGHLAAVIGAASISSYLWNKTFLVSLGEQIHLLWSPVLCGWISLLWHLFQQRSPRVQSGLASANEIAPEAISPVRTTPRELVTVDQSASVHCPTALILWSAVIVIGANFWSITNDFAWRIVTLAAVTWGLAIARVWDPRSWSRGWAVYCSSLSMAMIVAATIANRTGARVDDAFLMWAFGGLSAMMVLAVCVREWLRESSQLLPALRLGSLAPRQSEFEHARHWMSGLHSLVGIFFLGSSLLLIFGNHDPFTQRIAALLPLMSALSILPIATDLKHSTPRSISLGLMTVAAVLVSWSDLTRQSAQMGSDASIWWRGHYTFALIQRAFCVVVGLGWIYRWLSQRFEGWLDWDRILSIGSRILIRIGFCIGVASFYFAWVAMRNQLSATSIPWTVGASSVVAWVAMAGWLLQRLLKPREGAGDVSKLDRQQYFFGAEASLLGAAFTLRLHFPWLFAGWLNDWWPLVVYALAFGSVALGDWLRKREEEVLSDPILTQSLLLPLIPLLGAWLPSSIPASGAWKEPLNFSLLLLTSSIAYGLLGSFRNLTLLKALSGGLLLGSFWFALHSQERLRFSEHPQLWIIPPALATLVFIERNRDRLSASVVAGARYLAVMLIYSSSTMEMMLRAFETQFWSPLLLLAFAVAGILAGIAMRIRAFLFCGGAFVLVALVGMVWHAQRAIQQVWPWWAFGIATGIALIVLIGYFEKNRAQLLATIESLKKWQS
ncbi:MAG: hypothetical protein WCI02_17905, partial [Planctomycetota bacterium]